jgi:hypothetical protein
MSGFAIRKHGVFAAICGVSLVSGASERLRAQIAPQDVVGLVIASIEKNYAPIHSYQAKTRRVMLDPTVEKKTVTKSKIGNGTIEIRQSPRAEWEGALAVSGENCRFDISGVSRSLLVVRDGHAAEVDAGQVFTKGDWIPENIRWFANYDLREQGLLERADRLKLLLTKNYVDDAAFEPASDGGLIARITVARPQQNPITIIADAAHNFLPSRIYYYYPDDKITVKVVLDYERVPGLKNSWFLKRCKKWFSVGKPIIDPDAADWDSGCQTDELTVVDLQVNGEIPEKLFQLPTPKEGMSVIDADENSVHIFKGDN